MFFKRFCIIGSILLIQCSLGSPIIKTLTQQQQQHNLDNQSLKDLTVAATKIFDSHDDGGGNDHNGGSGNEVGYLKKSNHNGGDGYQHYETFHNKDGDAYGHEKHEAYGESSKSEDGGDKGAGGYQVTEHHE